MLVGRSVGGGTHLLDPKGPGEFLSVTVSEQSFLSVWSCVILKSIVVHGISLMKTIASRGQLTQQWEQNDYRIRILVIKGGLSPLTCQRKAETACDPEDAPRTLSAPRRIERESIFLS